MSLGLGQDCDLTDVFAPDLGSGHGALAREIDDLISARDAGTGAADLLARFGSSLVPAHPVPPEAYVREFLRAYVTGSSRLSSPRHLANMTTVVPALMPSLSALVTAINENLVKTEASPSGSACEQQVLAMLHRLVFRAAPEVYARLIEENVATGAFTSGATLANVTALWCARNRTLSGADGAPDVREVGLAGALQARELQGLCIVGPQSMHYSFDKAAELLGLGACGLVRVPLDEAGRIDVRQLAVALRRCRAENRLVVAVAAVAGSTDAGAVDPLAEVAQLTAEAGTHFHVDAAVGAPLLFSEEYRDQLAGIELADTVTVDGHKQLFAPTGVGAVLFRDPETAGSIEHAADYAIRATSRDLGRWSIEGSRPGVVLMLHAALHLLGRDGYRAAVDTNIANARTMAATISGRPQFELLLPPQTNVVLYRYVPVSLRGRPVATLGAHELEYLDRVNERVQKVQRTLGESVVSRTRWQLPRPLAAGCTALRAVLANPMTTRVDIEAVLDEQATIGDRLVGPEGGP